MSSFGIKSPILQSMTVQFRQRHLFHIPTAVIKLLVSFSAPCTFSTPCCRCRTTILLLKHTQHVTTNRYLLEAFVLLTYAVPKKTQVVLNAYNHHSTCFQKWRLNAQILTRNFVKRNDGEGSHPIHQPILFSLTSEQSKADFCWHFIQSANSNFSLYGRFLL